LENLNNNIWNAFKVIEKTYEGVEKMMAFCDEKAQSNGYESYNKKYLRYKSDIYIDGWYTQGFIKIYVKGRIGDASVYDVYVMNINFFDEPKVYISKHFFAKSVSANISPNDYWLYDNPIGDMDKNEFETKFYETYSDLFVVIPKTGIKEKYYGFEKAIFKEFKISSITKDNIEEIVFGTFDLLNKIDESDGATC
jgi:hypothetical protein